MANKFNQTDRIEDELKVFVTPVEIFEVPDLGIYEKMAYIVIRSHLNVRTSSAFPSYNTIAREGSMSRRKAIDAVAVLIERGLLTKEIRLDATKNRKIRNTSNLYTVKRPSSVPSVQHAPVHNNHQVSAQHATPLVQNMHHTSAQDAPKQYQLKKSIRTSKMNNNSDTPLPFDSQRDHQSKESVVVGDLIHFFANKEIPITKTQVNRLLQFASSEIIKLAVDRAIEQVEQGITQEIDDIVHYVEGMLKNGFSTARRIKNNAPNLTLQKKNNHRSNEDPAVRNYINQLARAGL